MASSRTPSTHRDRESLIHWYKSAQRNLPWRTNKKPYEILLSEMMLQQTTVAHMLPYYERFLEKFPNIESLAQANLDDVYAAWSGLGYYQRARHLQKTAWTIHKNGWPKTLEGLLALPGMGPYTARAVASLAFGMPTGVLDGNVIRVLCRRHGFEGEWWRQPLRRELQKLADELASDPKSVSWVNQGLMELGAMVCTPSKPKCYQCPWSSHCEARMHSQIEQIPKNKPRKSLENWLWQPHILVHNGKVLMNLPHGAPVLRSKPLFPGEWQPLTSPPQHFDFQHTITHHRIYVQIVDTRPKATEGKWTEIKDVTKVNPSRILSKALERVIES